MGRPRKGDKIVYRPVSVLDCVPANRKTQGGEPISVITFAYGDHIDAISVNMHDTERLIEALLVCLATAGHGVAGEILRKHFDMGPVEGEHGDGDGDEDDDAEGWKRG